MNNMNKNDGFEKLKSIYDNQTYFDQYGSSVIMLIILIFVLFCVISYCLIMVNVQPIIDDWPNQRCKPQIMPIAGLITHPEGVTASEYTAQNFTYCTQNILTSITGEALQPLTYVTSTFTVITEGLLNSLNAIRGMFDKIRGFF